MDSMTWDFAAAYPISIEDRASALVRHQPRQRERDPELECNFCGAPPECIVNRHCLRCHTSYPLDADRRHVTASVKRDYFERKPR